MIIKLVGVFIGILLFIEMRIGAWGGKLVQGILRFIGGFLDWKLGFYGDSVHLYTCSETNSLNN